MNVREGDRLRIVHLGQELEVEALNSTGRGDLGVLVDVFKLDGKREVLYVPFGIAGDEPGDERAVGAEPGASQVLDSMAGPLLLGFADDADIPQGEADGDDDVGGGEAVLDAPGGEGYEGKDE